MTRESVIQKWSAFFSAVALIAALALPTSASAQDDVEITHGGYGAVGGAVAFSLLSLGAGGLARVIYAPPADVDCRVTPAECRPSALDHVLMGTVVAGALAGVYFAGYGATKFSESAGWDPLLGWTFAGAYLGIPVSALLQNVVPQFDPDWVRQVIGIGLTAGGSVAAGFAFREITKRRGHAWPEYGFGIGGMAAGLALGSWLFPHTMWVPILGGVTSVLAASAATLAF